MPRAVRLLRFPAGGLSCYKVPLQLYWTLGHVGFQQSFSWIAIWQDLETFVLHLWSLVTLVHRSYQNSKWQYANRCSLSSLNIHKITLWTQIYQSWTLQKNFNTIQYYIHKWLVGEHAQVWRSHCCCRKLYSQFISESKIFGVADVDSVNSIHIEIH